MERIKRALTEARKERQKLSKVPTSVIDVFADEKASGSARHAQFRNTMLFGGAITVIVITVTIFVWRAVSVGSTGGIGMSALEVKSINDISVPAELQTRISSNNELRESLEFLNGRVDKLDESIASLEEKLLRVYTLVDSITASTALEATESKAALSKDIQQPATVVTKGPDEAADQGVISGEQGLTVADDRGAWVINLASLTSKDAADRFAVSAQSKGIQTELTRVTVKGKEYWRIQLTNFPTAKEARSYAGSVKEKLGLKDIWISRR